MSKKLSLCLTLALSAVCAAVSAQTVSVAASNATGAPGDTVLVDVVYTFADGFPLLSLDLNVAFDASQLTWNQAASTVTYLGSTAALDSTVAGLNATGTNFVELTPGAGSFSISLLTLDAPALSGSATLHAAFTLAPSMLPGQVTTLVVTGLVGNNDTGAETAYDLMSSVTAVPEPGAGWLLAAGLATLAGIGGWRRQRTAA